MTIYAERNEILFGVISQLAPRAEVMDLEVLRDSAVLTAPPIPRKHPAGEPTIRLGLKP